jgi:GNAT superfamily N-acetyltransferase
LAVGAVLPGDDIDGVVHFGVLDTCGRALSTCLLFIEPCPWCSPDGPPSAAASWHLRQMATDPSFRGRGLAGQVLAAVVDYIRGHGGGVLWCNARELAVPMYERGGLVGEGELFTDAEHTIPHLRMWRPIAS